MLTLIEIPDNLNFEWHLTLASLALDFSKILNKKLILPKQFLKFSPVFDKFVQKNINLKNFDKYALLYKSILLEDCKNSKNIALIIDCTGFELNWEVYKEIKFNFTEFNLKYDVKDDFVFAVGGESLGYYENILRHFGLPKDYEIKITNDKNFNEFHIKCLQLYGLNVKLLPFSVHDKVGILTAMHSKYCCININTTRSRLLSIVKQYRNSTNIVSYIDLKPIIVSTGYAVCPKIQQQCSNRQLHVETSIINARHYTYIYLSNDVELDAEVPYWIKIIRFDLMNLPTKMYLHYFYECCMKLQRDTRLNIPRYMIWFNKMNFVLETMMKQYEENGIYMWVDISIQLKPMELYHTKMIKNNKVYINLYTNYNGNERKIMANIFYGSLDSMMNYHKLFYHSLTKCYKNHVFISTEEHIMNKLYEEKPYLFKTFPEIENMDPKGILETGIGERYNETMLNIFKN